MRSGLRKPLAQRPDAAPRLIERLTDHPHDLLRARRVAVAADGLHRDVDLDAVERAHPSLDRHLHRLGGRALRVGDQGPRELARDQQIGKHTSELQSLAYLVCRLLLEKKKKNNKETM